jgi:hypothetical protein
VHGTHQLLSSAADPFIIMPGEQSVANSSMSATEQSSQKVFVHQYKLKT